MMRRLLLVACALSSAGCTRDEPTLQRQPGLLDTEGNPLNPTPVPPKRPAPAPGPAPSPFAADPLPQPEEPAKAPTAELVDAAVAKEAGPERDLSAELSAALAGTTGCVALPQAAAQADGKLRITVSAVILASGRISRASVAAPGQPPEALACMNKAVLAITLPEGIEGAPATVRGTTELQVKASPPKARDAGTVIPAIPVAPTVPVAPTNPNVAQPQQDDIARPDIDDLAGPP